MSSKQRTWSRELSVAMILGICVLIYFDKAEMVELVLWPVVAFVLPSFGFKQPALEAWMNKK